MKLHSLNTITYPDGHKHLKLTNEQHREVNEEGNILECSIQSFDDLFLLAQLKEICPDFSRLYIHYLLTARCDRSFSIAEACDLKLVAAAINSLDLADVQILKPHSSVALTLINNSRSYDIDYDLFKAAIGENTLISLVAPDAGAAKWVFDLTIDSHMCEIHQVQGIKTRASNGTVTDLEVYGNVMPNCVIMDDLCDGGATFIYLARKLREKGAKHISLCVTHGIFSKGYECFRGLIDSIYTTNSYYNDEVVEDSRINKDVIKKVFNVWM